MGSSTWQVTIHTAGMLAWSLPWSLLSNSTLCDTHHTPLDSTDQKAAWIYLASSGRQELLWIALRVREEFLAHLINCRCIDKAKVSETLVQNMDLIFSSWKHLINASPTASRLNLEANIFRKFPIISFCSNMPGYLLYGILLIASLSPCICEVR